jgi:hypothetical protein
MTIFQRKQKKTTLIEEEIARVREEMQTVTADSPEYAAMVKQLIELHKIKDPGLRESTTLKDWIPVIVYESLGHSFTSKAASFIRKP